MHLIYDKIYIEDFGDCLGMGKCGTCVVELINSNGKLISDFDRNEKETLRKAGINRPNSRLSCQLIVDENTDGLEIRIPDYSDR
jgi:2Fe-2S ferredoxin